MHMEDLSSATFSNLILQYPEVCIIQVFHLHGSSYTKVFYIIWGYLWMMLFVIIFSLHLSFIYNKGTDFVS